MLFYFILFSILNYCAAADPMNPVKCGFSAFQNHRKYFLMKNNSCYIPKTSSSEIFEGISTQNIYQGISGKITLFRLLSGSGAMPYDYFLKTGNDSNTVTDIKKNKFSNFRSILLDEWNDIRPLLMNFTIKDYDDNIAAGFLFKVGTTDNVTSWFHQRNLLDSFPWNISFLRSYDYNYFRIEGDVWNKRSFYINLFYAQCVDEKGIFGIMDGTGSCFYQNTFQNLTPLIHPQILFVNDKGQGGTWKEFSVPMRSLEIFGIYDSSFIFYI